MQRKQIKRRVPLAYQRGSYGAPVPVFVLDTATLWSRQRGEHNGGTYVYTFNRSDSNRYFEDSFARRTDGYLVAHHRRIKEFTRDGEKFAAAFDELSAFVAALPTDLRPVDVHALYESTRRSDDVGITVINNRYLISTWDDWVEKETARARAIDERRRREAALHTWAVGNRTALAAALGVDLKDLTFDGYRHPSVRISAAVLAAALGVELIPHPDDTPADPTMAEE